MGAPLLLGVLALACEETVPPPADGGLPGAGGGAGGEGGAGVAPVEVDETFPRGVSRFRRLTHDEWEVTVRDALLLDQQTGLSSSFRADPKQSGYLFAGQGDALEVDQALWQSYQRAAALIAAELVDGDALDPWLPADGAEEPRAREFIQRLGLRMHRRPLSKEQVDAYLVVYRTGTTAFPETPGFLGGIRLTLEALLQSPYFLYRVEESDEIRDGIVVLDGYERASRLSYFLWGTMPDDELLAAAEAGDLADASGVKSQARRMIADPRARDVMVNFFERVLDVERYESISPSETAFPDAPQSLGDLALEETRAFLRGVMAEDGGSLRDLLTSTTTYVDADLARIYGLEGDFGEEFERVTLDDSQRQGVLTQIGFLAAHATSRDPDPIHRGVFVARRVSCLTIAAPPDNVAPLPPNPDGKTNRQLVADHTEAKGSTCANCHATLINPFGFAFENYDALGAYRTLDGETEVDASGEVLVDNDLVEVKDALELTQALAASTEVHDCFSGYLVAYALGRQTMQEDEPLIAGLGAQSREDAVSFADLMVEMSVAVSFLNRSAVEEP